MEAPMLLLLVALSAHAGTVTEHGDLLTPRYRACAATLDDGRVAVIGGVHPLGYSLPTIEMFDPVTATVTPHADLPFLPYYPTCVGVGSEVWITDLNGVLYRYDPITGVAASLGPLPLYAPTSMAADQHSVYVEGYGQVAVIDRVTGTAVLAPANLWPRYSGPLLVASHGAVWLLGGTNVSAVERLPAGAGAWEAFGQWPDALTFAAGGALGSVVLAVAAPYYGGQRSAQLVEYDLDTGRGRNTPDYLNRTLEGPAAAVSAGRLWFFGGRDAYFGPLGAVTSWAPPTVGPDPDGDGLIDRYDDDDDGDGLRDWEDPCPVSVVVVDTDGDGRCDPMDACPLDPDDDADDDGVCGEVDPCPLDPLDDSDGDGSCDGVDLCTGDDAFGDVDADGVCGDFDPCPDDPGDDSDADGTCDGDDFCAGDDATGDTDDDGICDDLDFVLLATSMQVGQPARLAVFHAPPGATVTVWGTARGFGDLPCPLAGVCGSLAAPVRLGTATASGSGVAVWDVLVPATLPVGLDLLLEAVWLQGGAADVSGPVHRRVR